MQTLYMLHIMYVYAKKYVRTLKNVLMNTTQRYYFVDGHNGDTVHVDIYITLNCL